MDSNKTAFSGRAMDAIRRGGEEKKKDEEYNSGPSDRCGLWSQYAQQGLVIVPDKGDRVGVMYGWMCSEPTLVPTQGIRFRFSPDGQAVKEVLIFGSESKESRAALEQIHLQLTLGHRQLLHSNGETITQIAVNELETEQEEEGEIEQSAKPLARPN